jgi:hypothetical protein
LLATILALSDQICLVMKRGTKVSSCSSDRSRAIGRVKAREAVEHLREAGM